MAGHGWVNPLPSSARARCGGPGMCAVCAMEAHGVTITPRIEQLIRQREQLINDLQSLITIAREFRGGTFRVSADGETIECYHCDNIRRAGAGFYAEHHEPDCPVRCLDDWLIKHEIGAQQRAALAADCILGELELLKQGIVWRWEIERLTDDNLRDEYEQRALAAGKRAAREADVAMLRDALEDAASELTGVAWYLRTSGASVVHEQVTDLMARIDAALGDAAE